ncbi:glycosyltransferase family A protein [Methylocystis sp. B8]|uniref:glycosyltransferase family 2 protein n=1 Tax=Methylocystis sp. B8 TaxID=544938 RepID=UPI0014853D35|nr:glycosyltransferase family A protein [Methylocystis sp. B8]
MPDLAPIVLFVYNRPEHTRRTLDALAANPLAIESDLIIYADGPKRPEDAAAVQQARDVARGAFGFRSVRLIEREKNLGLANSIIMGVSDVCSARGRAIVVEDDLLVAPQFLTFLNRGLERYADEPSVFQVSGYMFPVMAETSSDGLFLPLISCWGWATWQREWSQFEPSATGYKQLERDPRLRARFNLDGNYDYFGMLKDQIDGKIDSWGVRWLLSVFLKGGVVLYPRTSLVQNVGIDESGTHGAGLAVLQGDMDIDADVARCYENWPSEISVDMDVLDRVKRVLSGSQSHPVIRLIRRLLK